ncbi:MAG: protein kinase [Candidatus Aminicenantes bacterium]|nr:protein kinase [Candidatus Aminicenantes bacterium]
MNIECPRCQTDNPGDSKFCKACATPLPFKQQFDQTKTLKTPGRKSLVGTTIAGKYKIVAELGKGGMGIVYKAEDIRLKRTVALKFLPPELTRDEEARERFVQEARAASALDHNNICTIHEIADAEDEHFFIAMAFYEGQSLKERIRKGPVEEKEAVDIAMQTALGLSKAHTRGIVHRDIKPANIIVTQDGVVKILDFGLAKLTGQVRLTLTGTKMGTPAYMSPEQAQGQEVDHRTDIWSLGVVLYEMLTGELPFLGEHEQSLVYSIINKEPHPIRKLCPNLSDVFERIVATALAKKPKDRYQKVDDLLDDLRSVAEGFEPLKAKAKSFQRKILGIRRPFFITGASALVFLFIAGGVLLFTGRSAAIESIAILPIENLTQEEELDYICRGIPDEIIKKLQSIESLKIPSRVAVEPYMGRPLKEMGAELKISKVLASTLELAEDGLRINLNLTEVDQGLSIWTHSLDFEQTELLALQKEMTSRIIDGLKLNLDIEKRETLLSAPTQSNKAYELFIRGEYEFQNISPQNYENAEKYYRLALQEDPEFALAHAGLAETYLRFGGEEYRDTQEAYSLAKQHARKALEMDDNLSRSHTVMGEVFAFIDWNWAEAEREYKEAILIDPRDETAHSLFGNFLSCMGQSSEAIKECQKAIDLDPHNHLLQHWLAWIYLDALKYDECINACQKFLDKFPPIPNIYAVLGLAYSGKGKHGKAIDAAQKGVDLASDSDRPVWEGYLGQIYGIAGQEEEALKILKKLEDLKVPGGWIIGVYLGLGDLDTTFALLEQAFKEHMYWMVVIMGSKYNSRFFKNDSRYLDLRRRMNLDMD